jgi:predicted ester cyclase
MSDIAACVEKARQSWNVGDLDGYLNLYDPTIQLHGYGPEPMDKASVVGFYRMIWGAMAAPGRSQPDLTFHEVMVDGAMYCCRFTMSGVHQGEFMGVSATELPYSLGGITMMRFEGEAAVVRWSSADFLGLMTQLGAIPPPA